MSLIFFVTQAAPPNSPLNAMQQAPLDMGTTLLAALAIVGLGGVIILLLTIIQRDEALRNSEVRYRTLVNTAIDGIIMIDEESVIRSFNPASERIFGHTAAEVIGQGIECLMPLAYRENYKKAFSYFLKSGVTGFMGDERETVGLRKDGSSFPAKMSITEARIGRQRFFTGASTLTRSPS
jgi:PAS domain S-box-containing protein